MRALAREGGPHRGLDLAGCGDGDGGSIAGGDRESIEANLVRRRRLVARRPIDLVVEHAMDQLRRPAGSHQSEDAQVHQQISVAVEDDGVVAWPRQRETRAMADPRTLEPVM